MIWKMHISLSVGAHLSGCLLMYINKSSLFICRGGKFPSVCGPVFRHTGIAQGSCGIISLGNSVWVRALGSLRELSDWIGLCSSSGKVPGSGDLQRPLPALSLLCNINICAFLHLMMEALETENKVIFGLPWSIKNTLTPCPNRVASLSFVLVVRMCCFLLRFFTYELCS